jgi:hypothetical protein
MWRNCGERVAICGDEKGEASKLSLIFHRRISQPLEMDDRPARISSISRFKKEI